VGNQHVILPVTEPDVQFSRLASWNGPKVALALWCCHCPTSICQIRSRNRQAPGSRMAEPPSFRHRGTWSDTMSHVVCHLSLITEKALLRIRGHLIWYLRHALRWLAGRDSQPRQRCRLTLGPSQAKDRYRVSLVVNLHFLEAWL
jgi:hypothetical protein